MLSIKNKIKKPRSVRISGSEVLRRVVARLRYVLPVSIIKDYRFATLFNDDCEPHSPRRAWMNYQKVYQMKMKRGGWIFAYGLPGGKCHLFDDVEADIALIRIDSWPLNERKLWEVVRYNSFTPTSNFDNFNSTCLVSQGGRILQRTINGFDLSKWAQEKYSGGKEVPFRPLKEMREGRNPFSPFLPDSLRLNADLAKDLSMKVAEFMVNN